jgi:chromosome segregation ATPase
MQSGYVLTENMHTINQLKDDNRRLCQERDDAINATYQSNCDIESLRTALSTANAASSSAVTDRECALMSLHQSEREIQDLRAAAITFRADRMCLLEDREAAIRAHASLRSAMLEVAPTAGSDSELASAVKEVKRDLDRTAIEIRSLRASSSALEADASEVRVAMQDLGREFSEVSCQLSSAQLKEAVASEEVRGLQSEVLQLKEDVNFIKVKHETALVKCEALQSEKKDMRQGSIGLENGFNKLVDDLSTSKDLLRTLHEKYESLQIISKALSLENTQLKNGLETELQSHQRLSSSLINDLGAYKNTIESIQLSNTDLQKVVEEVRRENLKLQETMSINMAESKHRLHTVSQEKSAHSSRIHELEVALHEVERELEAERELRQRTKNEAADLLNENGKLKGLLFSAEADTLDRETDYGLRMEELSTELTRQQGSVAQMKRSVEGKDKVIRQLQDICRELEGSLAASQEEASFGRDAIKGELISLRSKCAVLQASLKDKDAMIHERDESLRVLTFEEVDLRQQVASLEQEYRRRQSKEDHLTETNMKLSGQLESAIVESTAMRGERDGRQAFIEQERRRVVDESYRQQSSEARHKIEANQLRAELESARREIHEITLDRVRLMEEIAAVHRSVKTTSFSPYLQADFSPERGLSAQVFDRSNYLLEGNRELKRQIEDEHSRTTAPSYTPSRPAAMSEMSTPPQGTSASDERDIMRAQRTVEVEEVKALRYALETMSAECGRLHDENKVLTLQLVRKEVDTHHRTFNGSLDRPSLTRITSPPQINDTISTDITHSPSKGGGLSMGVDIGSEISTATDSNNRPASPSNLVLIDLSKDNVSLRGEVSRLESELTRLNERNDVPRAEYDGAKAVARQLKKALKVTKVDLDELQETHTRVLANKAAAAEKLLTLEHEMLRMKVALERSAAQTEEVESANKRVQENELVIFNSNFGTTFTSLEEGSAALSIEFSKKAAALLQAESACTYLKENNSCLSEEVRYLMRELQTVHAAKEALIDKLSKSDRRLVEEDGKTRDLGARLVEANDALLKLDADLKTAVAARETLEVTLIEAQRTFDSQSVHYKKTLTQMVRVEESNQQLAEEHQEVLVRYSELEVRSQQTLIRLSEVESTHASLLRKIIAWGKPGPDVIISSPGVVLQNDRQVFKEDKAIGKLRRKNALLRWAVLILKLRVLSS